MIKVYDALNSTEAHIVRGYLESHGIPARVEGDYLSGGIGELPVVGLIQVTVPEQYLSEAQQAIQVYETGQGILAP
jgi:hypothetical protein